MENTLQLGNLLKEGTYRGIYRREKLDNFTWRYAETGESISAGNL